MCQKLGGLLCVFALSSGAAHAATIDFDVDAFGSPIAAPNFFFATTPLTTLYAPIGVTFSGPAALSGGAILDVTSGFAITALSGRNFLAFNFTAEYPTGGVANDPETITFSTLMSDVSIWASGGSNAATFLMNAYDSGGGLIATSTVSSAAGAYAQLAVVAPSQIASVGLAQLVGDGSFVYDDLQYAVPEPSTALLLAISAVACTRRKR
ncbi:MAG: PEP-CTERM sorting domain-containing protein [Lacipirellulaceae bacterium]